MELYFIFKKGCSLHVRAYMKDPICAAVLYIFLFSLTSQNHKFFS